jgi:hypothetical protein
MKALDEIKTPPHAENVAGKLRERAKRADLKFSKAEVIRIASILDKLSYRCAEAYQVVGSLAGLAEVMDDPAVLKALDLFSVPLRPGDVLPFVTQKDRQRVIPKRRTKANSSPKTTRKKVGRKSRS